MKYYYLASFFCLFAKTVCAIGTADEQQDTSHTILRAPPMDSLSWTIEDLENSEFTTKFHHETITKALDVSLRVLETRNPCTVEKLKNDLLKILHVDYPEADLAQAGRFLSSVLGDDYAQCDHPENCPLPFQKCPSQEDAELSSLILLNNEDFEFLLKEIAPREKETFHILDELSEEEAFFNILNEDTLDEAIRKCLSDEDMSKLFDILDAASTETFSTKQLVLEEKKPLDQFGIVASAKNSSIQISDLKVVSVKTKDNIAEEQQRREALKDFLSQKKLTIGEIVEALKKQLEDSQISLFTVMKDVIVLRKTGVLRYPHKTKEEMEERQQKVLELAKQGKKTKDISRALKENYFAIYRDLRKLEKEGLVAGSQEQIQIRRQKVRELAQQGKEPKDISKAFKESGATIRRDLKTLENQGVIVSFQEQRTQRIEARRKDVLELAKKRKGPIAISKDLKKPCRVIKSDLQVLKNQGLIVGIKEQQMEETKKRQQKVLKLAQQGKRALAISKDLDKPLWTIERDLKELKSQGLVVGVEEQIKARKKKVLELANQGKRLTAISKDLDKPSWIIKEDLKELKSQGLVTDFQKQRVEEAKKRQQKVLKLAQQGKSVSDISKILKEPRTNIRRDLKTLENQGLIVGAQNYTNSKVTIKK